MIGLIDPSITLLLISGKQFYKVQKMEPSLMDAGQVVANTDWECSVMVNYINHLLYSRKIWWFGGLYYNCQIKSAKISYWHIYA